MNFEGRTAIVTGAASGLGMATAQHLLHAGARVGLVDRDETSLNEICQPFQHSALALAAELTSPEDVRRVVHATAEAFGGPHILVNAAGIAPAGRIIDRNGPGSLDDFRHVMNVNLIATFDVMRQCAAAMVDNEPVGSERGVIVNVSSGAAWQGQRGQAAYAASKAGVLGLTLPVARDLADQQIRVMAIAPGLFDTSMAQGLPENVRHSLAQMALHPNRLGEPREFANLVMHIIDNPYLNATTLNIDAGIRMV